MRNKEYKNDQFPPVETSVSTAAQRLVEQAEFLNDRKPYQLAQQNLEQCAIGDTSCMRFWRSVWVELMLKEYANY